MAQFRSTGIYTVQEKIDALTREINFRVQVYATKVANKSMTQESADYQMGIFEQIRADYMSLLPPPVKPLFD